MEDLSLLSQPAGQTTNMNTVMTQPRVPHPEDIIIAVMGPTGAGKSSFISLATGQSDITIGHDLESCTAEVRSIYCLHPDGSGRNVVFVDTPGFDDTSLKDTEILEAIADWLTSTYRQNVTLTGLLWLHRISDNRMSGSPLKNLRMFQKLCGNAALQNVILTTTMWDKVEERIGSMREEDLRKLYWKLMVDAGSGTARFHNTRDSAWAIIDRFTCSRRALDLQVEMVDKGLDLAHTSAGSTVFQWLGELIVQFRMLIRQLEARLRAASKGTDLQEAAEIEQEKFAVEVKAEQANKQLQLLNSRSEIRARRANSVNRIPWSISRNKGFRSGKSPRPVPADSPPIPSGLSDGDNDKGRDRLETRGQRLAATITALKHTRNVAEMTSLPFITGAIHLILTIAESVEAMKNTDQSLANLAHSAGLLILAIKEQEKIGRISDDLRQAIERLSVELQDIQALITRMSSRGPTSRYIFESSDREVVSACSSRISFARGIFELESAIINNHAIARIEGMVIAMSRGSTPEHQPERGRHMNLHRSNTYPDHLTR